MNGLAICAGIGGLELGIKRIFPEYRTVCFIERNSFAASVLVARMEDKTLDPAPIWDDLKSFNGRPWRGTVDIITSGFPCQPFSVAGKRRKMADERWIWEDIFRVIREIEPSSIFLENVPGLLVLHGGMLPILRDLAWMGYHAKWCCLSARSVGAPHKRKRLFIFADTDSNKFKQREQRLYKYKRHNRWLAEPSIPRVDDGTPYRVDRSFCLGNAVVPAQAAKALEILL